jgi:transcriptional regulator with XRE-family HTH domain
MYIVAFLETICYYMPERGDFMATNIGSRIMERRQQLGLTQEELAFRMGYKTKSAINKIELGINDVSQSKVVKFAESLHTSVAYLMGWNDEKEKPTEQDDGLSEETKELIDCIKKLPEDKIQMLLQVARSIR